MLSLPETPPYVPTREREGRKRTRYRTWKVEWGPTLGMLVQSNDELLKLATHVDRLGLQHQRLLQNEGLAAFISETKRRAALIRKFNPNCGVCVQVVLERTGVEGSAQALTAVKDVADMMSVWSMRDAEGIKQVITAVRGEAQ